VDHWGAEQIAELTALVAAAWPDEDLTADELLTACFEQPGVVLGGPGDGGAVAVGTGRQPDGTLIAVVRLLAVHPEEPVAARTAELLDAAEAWATSRGAARLQLGGGLPFALWPGVEADSGLAALARERGFEDGDALQSWLVPVAFRAAPPAGVVVRRAARDEDVTAVTLAVAATWPRLSDEVARALDHGTCHAAMATGAADPEGLRGAVLGVGCHSVARAAWVGPLVVRDDARRRGIGHALLGQICRDLMIADLPAAEVRGATSGLDAFLGAAGGRRGRPAVVMAKALPG
jgi:hypothetical protein